MSDINAMPAVGMFVECPDIPKVDVPSEMSEIISKLNEISDKYVMGEVLSAEDQSIVASYLPAVGGVGEVTTTAFDAYVGAGAYAFDREANGLSVHGEGKMGTTDSGEGRIECSSTMKLEKTGGDVNILEMDFTFRNIAFGLGVNGEMLVIFKRDFTRDFPAQDSAFASYNDRYTLQQRGFYFSAECKIETNVGTITIN